MPTYRHKQSGQTAVSRTPLKRYERSDQWETIVDQVPPTGDAAGPPARSASRMEWDDYAVRQGLDPAEFASKDDLVAAIEKEA